MDAVGVKLAKFILFKFLFNAFKFSAFNFDSSKVADDGFKLILEKLLDMNAD